MPMVRVSNGGTGTKMRAIYTGQSWGASLSLCSDTDNVLTGTASDIPQTGLTVSGSECSLQILMGSWALYFHLVFTPYKNGTLYRFDTGEKVCDCVANTPVTIANNIYYDALSATANYVFY